MGSPAAVNSNDALFDLIEARGTLDTRFTNLRRLGSGGFSLVLTATDLQSGDTVVVKVLHPFEQEQYRIEAFNRESEILHGLKDKPGIIRLISPRAEFTQELPPYKLKIPFAYYVVERAESDLERAIDSGGLSSEDKLLVFKAMCKSVQRIHSMAIVHRDLKPANFLLMSDGGVRLSDFGTARSIGQDSSPLLLDYAGFPPGDVRYMAPEILSSLHDVDAAFAFRGDMFSLGAILFELFTGAMLVSQLFDEQFQQDLLEHMAAIRKDQRREIYDKVIGGLADAHPLPNITSFAPQGPRCVLPIVTDLYRSLAALDYHKRASRFEYIFLKIDQALVVLRNKEKLKEWRARRVLYNEKRQQRRATLKDKWACSSYGERR